MNALRNRIRKILGIMLRCSGHVCRKNQSTAKSLWPRSNNLSNDTTPTRDRLSGLLMLIRSWKKSKDFVNIFPGHNTSDLTSLLLEVQGHAPLFESFIRLPLSFKAFFISFPLLLQSFQPLLLKFYCVANCCLPLLCAAKPINAPD